jgi:hypothetical protein
MSKVEEVLYKALEKGIYHETMSFASDIKKENPKMEVADRYELAYERAKTSLLKSSPSLNP